MDSPQARVGVVSDNASLVVALSLQASGFDVSRITLDAHVDHDVVVVDVPPGEDVHEARNRAPDGVPCLFLASSDEGAGSAAVLQRPYSLSELVTAIRAMVTDTPAEVHTAAPVRDRAPVPSAPAADRPAPPPASGSVWVSDGSPPDSRGAATGRRRQRRSPRVRARPRRALPGSVTDGEAVGPRGDPRPAATEDDTGPPPEGHVGSATREAPPVEADGQLASPGDEPAPGGLFDGHEPERTPAPVPAPAIPIEEATPTTAQPRAAEDPIGRVERQARALADMLADAPFLTSGARFAEGVATTLASETGAAAVGLWTSRGEMLEVVGASGLTDAERRLTLHRRHPLFEQAVASRGVLLENVDDAGALLLGVPGVRAPVLGVVVVAEDDIPVDFVTLSAERSTPGMLAVVEDFMRESLAGWRAVAAVEALSDELTH